MDVSDTFLFSNRDFDPVYLRGIFDDSFESCSELWANSVDDSVLVDAMENYERYCPVVEDISIEDEVLYSAVERIEEE